MGKHYLKQALRAFVFLALIAPPLRAADPTTKAAPKTTSPEQLLQQPTEIAAERTGTIEIETTAPVVSTTVQAGPNGEIDLTHLVTDLTERMELEKEVEGAKPAESRLPSWVPFRNWTQARIDGTRDKFNFVNRYRVGNRDVNRAPDDQQVVSVPYRTVMMNTAAAVGGIHVAESTLIGPGAIWAGSQIEGTMGRLLEGYGALLTFPVPTGTPIDLVTETGCLIVGALVLKPSIQRGIYRAELAFMKVAGPLVKKLGGDKAYNALFDTKTGAQKMEKLLASGKPSIVRIPSEDLGVRIENEGRPLAELHMRTLPNGDMALDRFSLHPEGRSEAGRAVLARELKPFGWDIRDAVLKPEMLVRGEHGTQVETSTPVFEYQVDGNSVRLAATSFVPKEGTVLARALQSTGNVVRGLASACGEGYKSISASYGRLPKDFPPGIK